MNIKKVVANKLAPAVNSKAERDRWIWCAGFMHQPKMPQKLLDMKNSK